MSNLSDVIATGPKTCMVCFRSYCSAATRPVCQQNS